MPEYSLRELWCKSERFYFGNYMRNFIFQGPLVDGQIVGEVPNIHWQVWKKIILVMMVEQVRHLPGGNSHAQDPWPARIFTQFDLESLWNGNKEEFHQIHPSAGVQGAIIGQSLHHVNEQSEFGIGELLVSKSMLDSLPLHNNRTWSNYVFWGESEKHIGGKQ